MLWKHYPENGVQGLDHAAASVGDKIYCFGGPGYNGEPSENQDLISVQMLDLHTLRWSFVEYKINDDAPLRRFGHTVTAYGEKVYLFGGESIRESHSKEFLVCFDTRTLEWSTPKVTGDKPSLLFGHSACLIDNRMYIFSGADFITDRHCDKLYYLDMNTMHWTCVNAKGKSTLPTHYHSAVSAGSKMYVFGACGDEKQKRSQVFIFDTITETWVGKRTRGKRPTFRKQHTAWVYDGYMYIFGGAVHRSGRLVYMDDMWRYSLSDHYWEKITDARGEGPPMRKHQTCVRSDDKVFLFGGSVAYNGIEDRVDGLHILEYAPSLYTLSILAVLDNNADQTLLPPLVRSDIAALRSAIFQ